MTQVVVFPGQGAQKVGMGRDFHDAFPAARAVFEEASDALGLDLAHLCFEDADRIGLTEFTQPAILTVEIAMLRVLEEEWGFRPAVAAGHSLGEYTALVATGALPLADAVAIVRERGRRMQEAVPPGEGAMAAFIHPELSLALVEEVLEGLEADVANVNSPEQVVVSGRRDDVAEAGGRIARRLPGVRVVGLDVSAPFHSRLMRPIEPGFREVLEPVPWEAERARAVVSNVTGALHSGRRDDLVDLLVRQVSAPVRWDLDMRTLLEMRPERIVEVGPRKVLRGFFRAVGVAVDSVFNVLSARRAMGG